MKHQERMNKMEKMQTIKELLGDKGGLLVRTDESGKWFIHCWVKDGTVTERWNKEYTVATLFEGKSIFNDFVDNMDEAFDKIISVLEKEGEK